MRIPQAVNCIGRAMAMRRLKPNLQDLLRALRSHVGLIAKVLCGASSRPRFDVFQHEHDAQRNGDIGHVRAVRRFVQLRRDVAPCRLSAVIFRQVPDQLTHVGERGNRHHLWDNERTREATRPVGALTQQRFSFFSWADRDEYRGTLAVPV